MFYILEDNIRIQKWKNSRPVCTVKGSRRRLPLDREEYDLLKACDGLTEQVPDNVLYKLEMMGLIRRCKKGEASLKADQIREYPNYFFNSLEWSITERCNDNCPHGFHAADSGRHREEFSKEEAFRFLREAKECGISDISLTGGEPALYPYIREVLQEMRNLEIPLDTLITNGCKLDEELIVFVKKLHPWAKIRIFSDDIGTDDGLRLHEGAEEQVKNTVRLCKKAGMKVKMDMNVNRRNRDKVFEYTVLCDGMDVDEVRITRSTEVPEGQNSAADDALTVGEYYDLSADFARQYKERGLTVPTTIWQSFYMNGTKKAFSILPVKTSACNYDEDAFICSALTKIKLSVQANGDILPCARMGGFFILHDIQLGNVKRDGLQKLLTEGALIENVMHTTGEKRQFSRECGSCRYFENCQGGCPALSLLFRGNMLEPDTTKCAFFTGDYYNVFCKALEGWKNLTPLQ